MDMQILAGAVLKRLLVSLAIFAVGFVFVSHCFAYPLKIGLSPCWVRCRA
jgi:hypothetical protein